MSFAKRMLEHSWDVEFIDDLIGWGYLDAEDEDVELIKAMKTYPGARTPAQEKVCEKHADRLEALRYELDRGY